MSDHNPKELFDKAYNYLLSGDIHQATNTFQFIVDRPEIFGDHVVRLAQQRILWYCIPLDIILAEMDNQYVPVDIHKVIESIFSKDNRYDSTEFQPTVKAIENHLVKLPFCVHVGKNLWMYRENLDSLATRIAQNLANSTSPYHLAKLFQEEWAEFCLEHDGFPDNISLAALGEALEALSLRVLSGKLVTSEQFLPSVLNTLAQTIEELSQPISLEDQIQRLFPSLVDSSEAISILVNYTSHNLDYRFIECFKGHYLTRTQIQFNVYTFEDLSVKKFQPLSTEELIAHQFLGIISKKLNPDFVNLVQSQLLKNPRVISIKKNLWVSKSQMETYRNQVNQVLTSQDKVISFDELGRLVFDMVNQKYNLDTQKHILRGCLQSNNEVIAVTDTFWLHKNKISGLVEKAYTLLRNIPSASAEKIISLIFPEIGKSSLLRNFSISFEEYLKRDARFKNDSRNSKLWQALPDDQRDNDLVYELLKKIKTPLSAGEISIKLNTDEPKYELVSDERFQRFPSDRWGLSGWVWLNDLAYEYLLQTKKHLHKNVIIGLVIKEHEINNKISIFLPEEDLRFSRDQLNRWFCRYQLKPNDIDRLIGELDRYAGAGRKLDLLFAKVLRLNPDATNADQVLLTDPRFINLDNLWYSRRKAFRELSEPDIEEVFDYLSSLPADSPPVSVKDIGLNALGWDGRLTNANELLVQDSRFIERHPGFWILGSWTAPKFERVPQAAGVGVKTASLSGLDEEPPSELPTKLTQRKRRNTAEELAENEQKRFYRTLSHLDVLHGNIRISGLLKKWIPKTFDTILLFDEKSNNYVAYIDETHTILNVKDWIVNRELSYGDKFSIQPGTEPDILFIRPYSKRDERVYQEAIQHQDIEKLIDEARRVNMTYHDLMIEVMTAFDTPLHREDIFQLVDYRRTATRNTIFEILSLPECPYEELRYFVPKGKGYWSFNLQRKRAFDMKMKELLDENASLRGQIVLLTENKEDIEEIASVLTQYKQQVQSLEKTIEALQAEKTNLATRISEVNEEKSHEDQTNIQLQENFAQVQQQLAEITDTYASTLTEMEMLQAEIQNYQKQETQFQKMQAELEVLHSEQNNAAERGAQLTELQARLEQSSQYVEKLETETLPQVTILQDQVRNLSNEVETLRDRANRAEGALEASISETTNLANIRRDLEVKLVTSTSEAQKQIFTLTENINSFEAQINDLTNKLQLTDEQINRVQVENLSLKEQLGKAHQQVLELKAQASEKLAKSSSRFQEQKTQIEEHLATIQKLEAQLTELSGREVSDKEYSSRQITTLTNQVSVLNSQLEELTAQYNTQQKELTSLNAHITQINRVLTTPLGRLFSRLSGLK